MTPDLKLWQAHFEEVEGRINHFYLDGADNVTIGIGCVIRDPLKLPMYHKGDTLPASPIEIQADFDAVKAMREGMTAPMYGQVCRLFISESMIDELFQDRLDIALDEIEAESITLDDVPDTAALALTDMAFNLGTHGLIEKFPKFLNAFKDHDWHTCALECKREGIQASRNEWTRAIFEAVA